MNVGKSGFLKIPKFIRAIISNNRRDRIAKNIPKDIPAGIRSAGDRKLFHDSGIFFTNDVPVSIVVMIEHEEGNFLNRKSTSYLAAQQLCANIGYIALRKYF